MNEPAIAVIGDGKMGRTMSEFDRLFRSMTSDTVLPS